MREPFFRGGHLVSRGYLAGDPGYMNVINEVERVGRLFDPTFTFERAATSISCC